MWRFKQYQYLILVTYYRALMYKILTPATLLSDPYVKIHTIHKEKRIDKKKTTIKKRTRDPVWNESFIFDVPLDKIRDLSFIFSVMDYDRITQNELIGQVILGYRTTGSSLQHWTEMMNNPRKPIAKWHRLQVYWQWRRQSELIVYFH
jgi:synaptotagmin-1